MEGKGKDTELGWTRVPRHHASPCSDQPVLPVLQRILKAVPSSMAASLIPAAGAFYLDRHQSFQTTPLLARLLRPSIVNTTE